MYSHNEKVRTCSCNPKKWLPELVKVFPRAYKLLPPCEKGYTNDPYLMIAFKRNRKTNVRQIEWVIRGYEEFNRYHSTIIYIPLEPIYLAPDERRDQNDCFLRLLQNGYHNITLEQLCEKYDVPYNPPEQKEIL